MARLSLVALLALALSTVVLAAPPALQEIVVDSGVHTAASWSYDNCGTWFSRFGAQSVRLSAAFVQEPPTTLST